MPHARVAVVMAGGSGERFWPLSRRQRPKQLLKLTQSDGTMLEEAVSRLAPDFRPEDVYVVTAEHLLDPIRAVLPQVPPENVVADPLKRNTAGALTYVAALLRARREGDLSLAIVTADHRIEPPEAFRNDVRAAMDISERDGVIVTIGVPPSRPETGYGYIEGWTAAAIETTQGEAFAVKRFHEKPSLELAEEYAARPEFLWNSGMFFWTLDTFERELARVAPTHSRVREALVEPIRQKDENRVREVFSELKDISIDYALLERASSIAVVRATFDWDDLGSWDAIGRYLEPDARGNAAKGDNVLVQSADCVVHNVSQNVTVGLSGVYGLLVVVTDDAVLICDREKAQSVRDVVAQLKERGSSKL